MFGFFVLLTLALIVFLTVAQVTFPDGLLIGWCVFVVVYGLFTAPAVTLLVVTAVVLPLLAD